jgi:hypothetical protein
MGVRVGKRGDGAAARDPAATSPVATGGELTDGERVAGTFEGGEALDLGSGDQVGLLGFGGELANIITV